MQFNFWWFTSNPTTNLIIATAIWFALCMICQRSCNKDQDTNPAVYIGYGIASLGMAFNSVFGIYGYTMGAPLTIIGLIIAIAVGRMSTGSVDTRATDLAHQRRRTERAISLPKIDDDLSYAMCPDCGSQVSLLGGTMKPDGSVVCTKCYKKFIP